MKRILRWFLWMLALVIVAPLVLIAWEFGAKPWIYEFTFNEAKATEILARRGMSGVKIATLTHHSGGPEVWLDGIEKFSGTLAAPFSPPTSPALATDSRGYTEAPGQWYRGTSDDTRVKEAIIMAQNCAEADAMGAKPIALETDSSRLFYSFPFVGPQDSASITALVYNTFDDKITYLHCNY